MYMNQRFGRYLDAEANCGMVVAMGSDENHVTPVTAITDIPYGVILGGDAFELDPVALVAEDQVDIGIDGELPCIAGTGGVTAGGLVVATTGGVVVDVPATQVGETSIVTLGVAKNSADAGAAVDVALMRLSYTIPAA